MRNKSKNQRLRDLARDGGEPVVEQLAVVEQLLSEGADVRWADSSSGLSALHWACRRGCDEIVSLLIAKNADVNARDHNDRTPLMHAAAECSLRNADRSKYGPGYLKIVRQLLEAGADTRVKNLEGRTARDLASKNVVDAIDAWEASNSASKRHMTRRGTLPSHDQAHDLVHDQASSPASKRQKTSSGTGNAATSTGGTPSAATTSRKLSFDEVLNALIAQKSVALDRLLFLRQQIQAFHAKRLQKKELFAVFQQEFGKEVLRNVISTLWEERVSPLRRVKVFHVRPSAFRGPLTLIIPVGAGTSYGAPWTVIILA